MAAAALYTSYSSEGVIDTLCLYLTGQVQGVGFRPFVYRLAQKHKLTGTVLNRSGQVEIQIQGNSAQISRFEQDLIQQAPPLAAPQIQEKKWRQRLAFNDFQILASQSSPNVDIHLPPDYASCPECLEEINDPQAHRYQYPFTSCTQCGPRYTIIKALPYDRINTTLADFPLCPVCQQEYTNSADRRFHAQPLACETCGPVLSFQHLGKPALHGNQASLEATVQALKAGEVVAMKGIGGYHLLCDARNDAAVQRLRERKPRPDKPLAVLLPVFSAEEINSYVDSTAQERDLLMQASRPIVLVRKKTQSDLSVLIAPNLNHIGVFLPYSPLHYLLLHQAQMPLVATSGNISGDPVLIDNQAAERGLQQVTKRFLHHNRPIQRPADDSVLQVIAAQAQIIRLGRGYAPLELPLPQALKHPVLALGGQLKVTIALAWDKRVVVSPHICDLGSLAGQQVFEQLIQDLQQLYHVKAEHLLCDQHPDYLSSRYARQQHLPVQAIYHHYAHASSLAGSYPEVKSWLCFSWDGTGLGADSSLWGGETFWGTSGNWQRLASLRPFYLPGGDKAGRAPWRSAAALCWQTGKVLPVDVDPFELQLSQHAWQKRLNCPQSHAMGRLFDAMACLILGHTHSSFEGQAPMQLEALCRDSDDWIALPISTENPRWIDWQPLLDLALNPYLSAAYKATVFHNSLAHMMIDLALSLRADYPFEAIGLAGGVFQNCYLVEKIFEYAQAEQLEVFLPQSVSVNDGGLSYGQVLEYQGSLCGTEKRD